MRWFAYLVAVVALVGSAIVSSGAAGVTGQLDPSFGGDGMVTTRVVPFYDNGAHAVAVQSDGRVVTAGFAGFRIGVVRYLADGSLDPSFGGDGTVETALSGAYGSGDTSVANAVAIQPDGRIVVAGRGQRNGCVYPEGVLCGFGVARYLPDGSLDPSFAGDGTAVVAFVGSGRDDVAHAVALQPDGKIVTAGTASVTDPATQHTSFLLALARFNPDGSLDPTFDLDGWVTRPPEPGESAEGWGVAVQPDGRIVAAGEAGSGVAVHRFLPGGQPDPTFGVLGTVRTELDSTSAVRSLTLQPDGRILVAGNGTESHRSGLALVRYLPDGTLDASFDGDGVAVASAGTYEGVTALGVQSDGGILAAASVAPRDPPGRPGPLGRSRFAVARFLPDGRLDPMFGDEGMATADFPQSGSEQAFGLALQPDGRVVVAGVAFQNFAVARFLTGVPAGPVAPGLPPILSR